MQKNRYPRLDTVIQLHSERDTTRKWTVVDMVMLRDLHVEALYTLPYLGAQQLIEKGAYLIDTANQKNVTLNLDFAES